MAVALSVVKQKRGVNFSTLAVALAMSGNYVQGTGEIVSLVGATIPNPGAQTVSGPSVNPLIPPRITVENLGGYVATLVATNAATLQYRLQFWNGTAELATAAYPAAITGGQLQVEIDFGTGSFDS